jgi:anti-anti-sigma factor
MPEDGAMASSDRAREKGSLNLASTFLDSFPPSARSTPERRLASLDRIREDGILTLQVEPLGDELVVRASGELDIASAKALEDELRRAIDSDASAVALDLGGVTFIDSTGLRGLLLAATQCDLTARQFRLLRVSKQVKQVIETSGVADILPVAD